MKQSMKKSLKKLLMVTFISTFSAAMSPSSLAGDTEKGKQLYDAKCHGCHDTRIHTRPNRIIHTYSDLVNRVKFCDTASKAGFSEADMADVTEYLNTTFYKFIKD